MLTDSLEISVKEQSYLISIQPHRFILYPNVQ